MKRQKALKNSSKGWAARSLKHWACIASVAFVFALPAFAQEEAAPLPSEKPAAPVEAEDAHLLQDMHYDVYAGGIHAVQADMTLDYRTEGRYEMMFAAETRGMLGFMAPWKGSFSSKGWANGETFKPELHESVSVWREEQETKSYYYNKNGTFKELVTHYKHKKPRTRVPDEELTKDTVDALTATMMVMEHVANGGKCEGSADVFDGKRRYALVFEHVNFVNLKKSRYNAYEGVAAECTAEVKPLSGAWHSKPRGWLSIQEQGRERGTMPTVWMARVREGATAVPVKVRVKTAYGTMFMHMTRYESGQTVLTPKR